jgi:hypothetical protein
MTLDPKEYAHLIPETKTIVNQVVKNNLGDAYYFPLEQTLQ